MRHAAVAAVLACSIPAVVRADNDSMVGDDVKPSLVVNTAIHAETPDTVLRVILEGARSPGLEELGAMPPFLHHLDDAQIAELAAYLRARFARDKPPWSRLAEAAARLRNEALTAAGGPINR